jgi:MFS family permease
MNTMQQRHQTIPHDARAEGGAPTWSAKQRPGCALAGLSLSTLLSSLGTSIANVALPTLAQAFGVSFQAVQWIVLAYLLATTALIVGAGRLGDIVGRRRLLLTGLALFAVASVLCAAAPALWLLIAGRAAQGLGRGDHAGPGLAWSARRSRRSGPGAPWGSSARCPRSAPRSARRSAAS